MFCFPLVDVDVETDVWRCITVGTGKGITQMTLFPLPWKILCILDDISVQKFHAKITSTSGFWLALKEDS